MNFKRVDKYPKVTKWLTSKLGYYYNGMYSFCEGELKEQSIDFAYVVIVAKCHYNEDWKSFSSINKKDLLKIIQFNKSIGTSSNDITQVFENKAIDGFDVKTTIFDKELLNRLNAKKVLIPETELFNEYTDTSKVFQLETLAGTLFCGGHQIKLMSSYAKGIMTDIEVYKLSAGLHQDTQATVILSQNFPDFLLNQLFSQKLNILIKKIRLKPKTWFNVERLHILYLAPLLTALCFYVISNSYLFIQSMQIENKLAEGGDKVNKVLAQKRLLDEKSTVINILSTEFEDEHLVHNYWEIIFQLISQGMKITRITYSDHQLTVRGDAEQASHVLGEAAKNNQVESVVFEGPVRKSNSRDDFILKIKAKEKQ